MRPGHAALLVVINLVWGLNFVAAKLAVIEIPAIFAAALRFMLILVLLMPFLKVRQEQVKHLFIVSLLMGVGHFGLFYLALAMAEDVSSMAIVVQTNVPIIALMAVVFLGEKLGWRQALGIATAFSGVMVLGFDPRVFNYIDAVIVAMIGTICYSTSIILIRAYRETLKDISPMTFQGWIALSSIPALMLISFLFESGQWTAISENIPWAAFGGIAFSAIGASLIGHGGMYYLLKFYPASQTAPYTLLSPVFAILSGILVFDETLTWRMVVGAILTLGGVAIIIFRMMRLGTAKELPKVRPS